MEFQTESMRTCNSLIATETHAYDIGGLFISGALHGAPRKDVEVFSRVNPPTPTGFRGPEMIDMRKDFLAVLVDNTIYVVGGTQLRDPINGVEKLYLSSSPQ